MYTTKFCKAIYENDIEEIKNILKSPKFDCNLPIDDDKIPLFHAFENKNIEIIKLIMSHESFNFSYVKKYVICYCFCYSSIDIIKYVVEKIIKLPFKTFFTPENDAYINLINNNSFEICIYLIDVFGINLKFNIINKIVKTKNKDLLNKLSKIIKDNFEKITDKKKSEIFLYACVYDIDYDTHPKLLEFLIPNFKINLNEIIHKKEEEQEKEETTYLFETARLGSFENMKYLIESGANIHYKNKNGKNVLFYIDGETEDDIEKIVYLHDKGVDINLQDNDGNIPLTLIPCSEIHLIKLLLALGANPKIENSDGNSYIDHVIMYESFKVLKFLLESNLYSQNEIKQIKKKYKKQLNDQMLDILDSSNKDNLFLVQKFKHKDLRETKATELFVYFKLFESGYFKFNLNNEFIKFFDILLKLPTEIQMMICCLSMDYKKLIISQKFINFCIERIL
jgi:hypothetical protein